MQPSLHKRITSAVPVGANAAIRQDFTAYVAACRALGMAGTLPNIALVAPYWRAGYSPECAVRFFGVMEPQQMPVPVPPRRISHSVGAAEFKQAMLALAHTGNLIVTQPSPDSAIFTHAGRQVGMILTVNGVQDRVLFTYDNC